MCGAVKNSRLRKFLQGSVHTGVQILPINGPYAKNECRQQSHKLKFRKLTQVQKTERIIEDIKEKEYLSFSETGRLLGLSRQAIYTMVKAGHLKASKISSRLSFIRRTDIDAMLQNKPYQYRMPKDTIPITDFYTTNEIKEKFGVKDSWIFHIAKEHNIWIFHIAKEHNIPRTFNRGKTYWSKKHFDDYFAKKAPDPEIKEWYSTQDMQEKFGMTLTAIYSFVSKNAIPKKKVGIMVYYSKKHVDIAKGLIAPEEPKYYTIAEAMERFFSGDKYHHHNTFLICNKNKY